MTDEAVDLLMGGSGPPSFFNKDSEVGDTLKGTITRFDKQHVRDFVTQKPKYWDDGNPVMQPVITVRDDDGDEWRLFCTKAMTDAIREAVQAAEVETPETGARLAVQFTGTEPSQYGNDRKLYKAQYEPAKQTVSADSLL